MGAWGTGVFDNDDAADFVAAVDDDNIYTQLGEAFKFNSVYVSASDGAVALAGAALVALQTGLDVGEGSEEVADLTFTVDDALRDRAVAAVERVLGDGSELVELWEDSEDYENFLLAAEKVLDHLNDN